MTDIRLQPGDSETIAAFLDGELSDRDRRDFMDRLDRDEALYEVFIETVRYREAASGEGGTVLDHPTRFRRPAWVLPSSVAALLALALALPFLLREGGLSGPTDFARALAADSRLESLLEDRWTEQGWRRTRGVTVDRPTVDSAFRAGVHSIDLEIALRLGRLDDARELLRGIDRALSGVEQGDDLRVSYAELAEELESGLSEDRALERVAGIDPQTRELLDFEYGYSFGRWVEAGKLAARSGNRELLVSKGFRAGLGEIRKYQWTPTVNERLDTIESAISGTGEPDLTALEAAFTQLINES